MNCHVLSTRSTYLGNLRRYYHVGKAASVNSAIERNLRKFGPARPGYTKQRVASWKDFADTGGDLSSKEHNGPFNPRDGSFSRPGPSYKTQGEAPRWDGHHHRVELRSGRSRHSLKTPSQRSPHSRERYTSASHQRSPPIAHASPSQSSERYSGNQRRPMPDPDRGRDSVASSPQLSDVPRARGPFYDRNSTPSFSIGAFGQSSETSAQIKAGRPHTASSSDRLPLSIPYTTPASEFLYGTSVVEAALRSQRTPRRKLYKLYIYNGENREVGERDDQLERLARKNGVQVVRVGNEGLRLMEKLSSGRPHNGYILEASPIPRMPVRSLGQPTIREGQSGFLVTLGHQSREEAIVNGMSDFLPTKTSSGRMPFVLLLDGIVDPGNMGGILRTAGFLGASAVAISTRNSAPFTPVVLKASAGASENLTLFSVASPAEFIVESQRAGWRLFAGVAPSTSKEAADIKSVSTDDLGDPLIGMPCILMLGSEGAGLRWNLRSKADVELYIRGCEQTYNVDSLNVSVAAGILCSAFLATKSSSGSSILPKSEKALVATEDLF